MTEETIRTIVWGIVLVSGINATAIYAVVRLAVTGRTLFERQPERGARIIGLGRD